jgi:hypothetical protein
VIRTGWWAGDENCIDDILYALNDMPQIIRLAAESIGRRLSPGGVFNASQLLYHLRFGEDCGMRSYVQEQYKKALHCFSDPNDLREVKERLNSGLHSWKKIEA